MKIVFDLDEVIFDWINDFLRYVDRYWDHLELEDAGVDPAIRNATSEDADTWEFFAKWNLNRSLFESVYDKYCNDRQFALCPLTSRSLVRDIGWLSDSGVEIVYCTSRPLKTILDTKRAMDENNIYYDKIYHCGAYLSKQASSVLLDKRNGRLQYIEGISQKRDIFIIEKPDIAVDDKPEYIMEAHESDVPSCVLVSTKYNKIWRAERSQGGEGKDSSLDRLTFTNNESWESIFQEVIGLMDKKIKVGK